VSFAAVKRSTFFRDLERVARSIAQHNPSAAAQFLEASEATVNELTRHPGLGPELGFRRALGYRSFRVRGFDNYLIFYKWRGSDVVFARLLHGARDLPRLLRTER